ncbi:unnamed protein product, partial [Symbiodinium sp. KB8]
SIFALGLFYQGELSDEVSSCDALLGETSLEGETSSDSSSSSEDAVEEATVLAKKAVKAKPVAAADAAKDKEERKGGKGGKGPPEELRRPEHDDKSQMRSGSSDIIQFTHAWVRYHLWTAALWPSVEDYLPADTERAPGPASEAQRVEDEGYGVGEIPMEVDACWSVASYERLEVIPLELAESFAIGIECRQSVVSSIEDDSWTELKMRDRANERMAKEIKALNSLRVGDAITKQEADAYCREHGMRILSTRWVSVAKKEGETLRHREIENCGKGLCQGSPTAAELGISSPTSSNEAFRSFLVCVSATDSEIVLAD